MSLSDELLTAASVLVGSVCWMVGFHSSVRGTRLGALDCCLGSRWTLSLGSRTSAWLADLYLARGPLRPAPRSARRIGSRPATWLSALRLALGLRLGDAFIRPAAADAHRTRRCAPSPSLSPTDRAFRHARARRRRSAVRPRMRRHRCCAVGRRGTGGPVTMMLVRFRPHPSLTPTRLLVA
jgi:hypothetical protein